MTLPTDLAALFKQAADIASQVPEPLRAIAFQRALDALLVAPVSSGGASARPASPARAAASRSRDSDGHSADVTKLLETLDRTELAALLRGRKVLDRALLLLRAAQNHGIDAMTSNDIATVLAKKFREPTSTSAVRMALDRSPSYTDRRPSAGSYMYSLMAPGEDYLDSLSKDAPSASGVAPAAAKAQRKARVAPKAVASGVTAKPKAAKRRGAASGRPGPKVILETILVEGFFSTPRTMSDILTHLREDKTYNYRTSDMTATLQRLVRQQRLIRSRNAESQFQYTAK